MNKYPYIGESTKNGTVVLFCSKNHGSQLWRDNANYQEIWNESLFKNITTEYLTNTYGKVESKEHAEFIKLIAENEGIKCNYMVVSDEIKYFCFSGGVLFFTFSSVGYDRFKLITIPPPPKEKLMESQKEWPAVGDDILYDGSSERLEEIKGEIVKVIGRYSFDNAEYITVSHNEQGIFAMRLGSWIKKPPTQKDELDRKLYDFFQCNCEEDLAEAIINGEIEGLEYKHG